MIGRLLASALVSGLLTGVLISVIQEFTTTPIILHAEAFEGAGGHDDHAALMWTDEVSGGQFYLAHSAEEQEGEEGGWGPQGGLERTLFTTAANLIAGVGFAALLVAGFHLAGRRIDGRERGGRLANNKHSARIVRADTSVINLIARGYTNSPRSHTECW